MSSSVKVAGLITAVAEFAQRWSPNTQPKEKFLPGMAVVTKLRRSSCVCNPPSCGKPSAVLAVCGADAVEADTRWPVFEPEAWKAANGAALAASMFVIIRRTIVSVNMNRFVSSDFSELKP
jgi:hypothetical protein